MKDEFEKFGLISPGQLFRVDEIQLLQREIDNLLEAGEAHIIMEADGRTPRSLV